MFRKKKFDMSKKRQIMMIIAIVCVVCFVAVFLVSAIHFNSHSGHASISARSCQRTLMPECRCDPAVTPVAPVRIQVQSQTQAHVHNGSHVDCFVCVIVQKTVDQIRQLSVAEILISDLGMLILAGSCFMFIITGVSTPVKLKTRTNN